jgi:hypothetical protein
MPQAKNENAPMALRRLSVKNAVHHSLEQTPGCLSAKGALLITA